MHVLGTQLCLLAHIQNLRHFRERRERRDNHDLHAVIRTQLVQESIHERHGLSDGHVHFPICSYDFFSHTGGAGLALNLSECG